MHTKGGRFLQRSWGSIDGIHMGGEGGREARQSGEQNQRRKIEAGHHHQPRPRTNIYPKGSRSTPNPGGSGLDKVGKRGEAR